MPCVRNDAAARRAPPKPKPTGAPARSRVSMASGNMKSPASALRRRKASGCSPSSPVATRPSAPVTVAGPGPRAAAAVRIADEFLTASALAADSTRSPPSPPPPARPATPPRANERGAAADGARVRPARAGRRRPRRSRRAPSGPAEAQRAGRDGGRRVRLYRAYGKDGSHDGESAFNLPRPHGGPRALLTRARSRSSPQRSRRSHRARGRACGPTGRTARRPRAMNGVRTPAQSSEIFKSWQPRPAAARRDHQARGRVGGAAGVDFTRWCRSTRYDAAGRADRLAAAPTRASPSLNKTTTKGTGGRRCTPRLRHGRVRRRGLRRVGERREVQTGADAPPGTPPAERSRRRVRAGNAAQPSRPPNQPTRCRPDRGRGDVRRRGGRGRSRTRPRSCTRSSTLLAGACCSG